MAAALWLRPSTHTNSQRFTSAQWMVVLLDGHIAIIMASRWFPGYLRSHINVPGTFSREPYSCHNFALIWINHSRMRIVWLHSTGRRRFLWLFPEWFLVVPHIPISCNRSLTPHPYPTYNPLIVIILRERNIPPSTSEWRRRTGRT